MALDATVGGQSADTYATIAEAKAEWDAIGFSYASYSDTQIEQAMRRARRWLDGTYLDRYPGERQYERSGSTPQALEWPRSNAVDRNGYPIDLDSVPEEIKTAQIAAAKREVAGTSLLPDVTPGQTKVLVGVDSLRWQATGGGGVDAEKPWLHEVESILAPLIGGKSKMVLRA